MRKVEKEAFVQDFEQRVSSAPALYLTDFTGLNVKAMTQLRARLREIGAEYLVVKNRLALRALERLGLPDVRQHLKGPTGVVIGHDGPVEAARVLREFAQEHEQRPAVKAGLVERAVLGPQDIERIARLPSRDVLRAQVLGLMQAPLAALAGVLEAKLRETLGLVEALRAQRAAGSPAE